MARPEFKATAEQRRSVMLGRAFGMPVRSIAGAIGVAEGTLTKHFAYELQHGPEIMRRELMAHVAAAAMTGKKSAMSLLERMARDDRRATGTIVSRDWRKDGAPLRARGPDTAKQI